MKNDSFKTRLTRNLWSNFKDIFYSERIEDTAVIQNLNFTATRKQKKAIVCYLTVSYTADWGNQNIGRTQPLEILSIVKVLSDLDYAIDVVNCNDMRALPIIASKDYHLVFGFGEVFYQLTLKHPNAMSIIYMTEHHPDFADREEKKRIAYFYERHQKKARIVRSGNYYKSHYFNQQYSHLVTLGEVDPFLKEYKSPFTIFPTGVVNTNFVFEKRDHVTTRNHFLWLGSFGAVHKGLDLLLDVFENRDDLVLHIAGLSEEDEALLTPKKRANIINHGYLNVKTETFLELVKNCSFNILPSCSEGFSTAITTGMFHGLIPIVMRDTGFNRLKNNAIFLEDYKVPYLNQKLTEISARPSKELANFSKSVFEFAHENFSNSAFEMNFKEIIDTIMKNEQND
ncbi:glycosyltransferase family 4 protein [Aggregatimonas sangjinii]|uniref:Glycosyltransferase family 4 protein n=1 Tax=Aggregatimonas sangjinii TaxID=2583587 RepID=A0A5B7SJQ6_9FLAO|nr:glycosyltransferase [Aggregatimonas sangjinii]QCW98795.1 glycosyltransferase family 4 protein [Aggregatimonas sangjinii]